MTDVSQLLYISYIVCLPLRGYEVSDTCHVYIIMRVHMYKSSVHKVLLCLQLGNSDIWRRRYFTLTKEFLFYSKSEQVHN